MKKIYLLIILFLVVGAYFTVRNNNIDMEDEDDRKRFLVSFTGWLLKVGRSTKNVASYAAEQEWLPEDNETNQTIFVFEENEP